MDKDNHMVDGRVSADNAAHADKAAVEARNHANTYRWVILALCTLVMTTSFAARLAWGNAAAEVSSEMGFNATTIGSFVTAFFTGYIVTNAFSGYLADRFGPRFMICAGLFPLAGLVAMFGLMRNAPIGLAIQVAMGLTAGVNYSACVKLCASWFGSKERGLALGILSAASSTALVLANTAFPPLMEWASWRVLYFCLGGEVLLTASLAFIALRDAPISGMPGATKTQESFMRSTRALLTSRNFRYLAVVEFGGLWAVWGVAFWANALMVKGHNLSNVAAGHVTALIGVGGFIAKPLYGWLSDILPVRRKILLLPALIGLSICLLVFGFLDQESHFLIFAPVLGIFAFGFTPLMAAILTEITEPDKIGAAAGLMNAIVQFSALLSPLMVGVIYDHTGSFLGAFLCLAAGPPIAALAALMIDEPERKGRMG